MKVRLKFNTNFDKEITAVIATLGEESLKSTIETLSKGSTVPASVLLCIPDNKKKCLDSLSNKYPFVKIVCTNVKGQVAQRIVGFRMSKTKYTLQLDSDVIVDKDLIKNLKKAIETTPNSCVGPSIYRYNTLKRYSFLSDICDVFGKYQKRIILYILNGEQGYQPGVISKGGIGFGPDDKKSYQLVEWLPGCCILHETKHLLLSNYYSYRGKAYSEDYFHSHYLRKNGVIMFNDKKSKLYVRFPNINNYTLFYILKEQFYSFVANVGFVKISNKSLLRYSLYSVLKNIFLLTNLLLRKFKKNS